MEEENFLELLSRVYHLKKRTQIKARKLHFDEHLHLVKRQRIEAEYDTTNNEVLSRIEH